MGENDGSDHTHEELVRLEAAVETFIEGQRDLNLNMSEFLTNHWPHLTAQVGGLEGKLTILMVGIGATASLLIGILVRLLIT